MGLNLLDEGRRTYSLCRICVLSLIILLALRRTCFSYKAVREDCLKPVILLLMFTTSCNLFLYLTFPNQHLKEAFYIYNDIDHIDYNGISGAASTNLSCPKDYRYFGGNCYRYYPWVMRHYRPEDYRFQESWHKALRQCERENATLASIHSEEEAYFLKVRSDVLASSLVQMFVQASSQAKDRCIALQYPWLIVSQNRGSQRSRTLKLCVIYLATSPTVGTAQIFEQGWLVGNNIMAHWHPKHCISYEHYVVEITQTYTT